MSDLDWLSFKPTPDRLSGDNVPLTVAAHSIAACNAPHSEERTMQAIMHAYWGGALPAFELKTPQDCDEYLDGPMIRRPAHDRDTGEPVYCLDEESREAIGSVTLDRL